MKDQTARKPDIRVQKTFSRLLDTFFQLMHEQPYDSITVLDICNEAGVHRATFYKHFIDKQDFVNFCFEKKIESLNLDRESFLLGNSENTKADYIELFKRVVNFVYDNRDIITNFNDNTTSSAFATALTSSIADAFEKRLSRDEAAGAHLMSPVPMLAHYYAGAIVEILKWWAIDGGQYTRDDIIKFVTIRFSEAQFSYKHSNLVFNQ
ncbi:MAG: TetR/AcrR family transcriptional regulator [Oscillospiraceae bacterium]|nr:TetR/AcrR family transcriptional regulator [Oscillospiraceae bacterium]